MNDSGVRTKPLAIVPPYFFCNACAHLIGEHDFMYGIGSHDRYRCRSCDCGKQYEIKMVVVDSSEIDTPEKRAAWIAKQR